MTQAYDSHLSSAGLRITQFTVLVAVDRADAGGARMSVLADALDMDASTLSRILKGLAREGLVALDPGADRRERCARLTAAGRDALAAALPLWQTAQAEARAHLGPAALRELSRLTRRARDL